MFSSDLLKQFSEITLGDVRCSLSVTPCHTSLFENTHNRRYILGLGEAIRRIRTLLMRTNPNPLCAFAPPRLVFLVPQPPEAAPAVLVVPGDLDIFRAGLFPPFLEVFPRDVEGRRSHKVVEHDVVLFAPAEI